MQVLIMLLKLLKRLALKKVLKNLIGEILIIKMDCTEPSQLGLYSKRLPMCKYFKVGKNSKFAVCSLCHWHACL